MRSATWIVTGRKEVLESDFVYFFISLYTLSHPPAASFWCDQPEESINALFHSVDGYHLTVPDPGLHVVCTLDTGGKGQKVGEYGRLHYIRMTNLGT
jgi:hypothetical protein